MIRWTKHRKRCPDHGLVLSEANYCPACGEQLTVVSVPYLFQVYFHPAIMIVPGILLFFGGLFFFLDVRGCVVEGRKVDAAQAATREDLAKRFIQFECLQNSAGFFRKAGRRQENVSAHG